MNRVAIVDYGLCNVDSVKRAIEECGGTARITQSADDLEAADRIIMPGVGAFPDAMANLQALGLDEVLYQQVFEEKAPFLGVCLGMQLLATVGHEVATTKGLGWIGGSVEPLQPTDSDERVPHIGWNEVVPSPNQPLFDGIEPGTDFYFVHGFHFVPDDAAATAAVTPYCGGITSAVASHTVFGVQFHPEKSQQAGFQVLRNFLSV